MLLGWSEVHWTVRRCHEREYDNCTYFCKKLLTNKVHPKLCILCFGHILEILKIVSFMIRLSTFICPKGQPLKYMQICRFC